jgi:hypothetical protein
VGWTDQYGSVFMRPGPLGKYDVVVTDPKAVAHIYAGMEVRRPPCAMPALTSIRVRPPTSKRSSVRSRLAHS